MDLLDRLGQGASFCAAQLDSLEFVKLEDCGGQVMDVVAPFDEEIQSHE